MNRYRFIAVGLFSAAASMTAYAQAATTAAPADEQKKDEKVIVLEEYKVTSSFRGSLAAAAEKKESAQNIVEVIASEDIGKLPDVSIADSLTRLTGLTTQRTNGRSQAIAIRGLTGDFSTGMLNGREQVSTGQNRAVEFDQYPAELLEGVTVYKTAAANLTGQGLAGTIDLQTVHPLSKSGRTIAVNGYYEWTAYNQLTPGVSSKGERFNLSYVDQLDGGKFGIALGYSHSNKPYEGKQFQAWGYDQPGGNYLLGGTKSYVRTSNLSRDGFMGVLEFKPNENIHSTVDFYYSNFEEKQLLRGIEIPLAPNWTGWNGNATALVSSTTSGGYYTKAVIDRIMPVLRNDIFKRKDSPFAIGWNLELGKKSDWPVTVDAGYSRINRTDKNLETWSGFGFTPGNTTHWDKVTVELHPGNIPTITPTVDYTNTSLFSVTDPQGWQTWMSGNTVAGPGWLKFFKSKDEMGQFKVSTVHPLQKVFKEVELGLSYSDRYKSEGEGPSGLPVLSNGKGTLAIPTLAGYTDMSYLGIGKIYAYDPEALFNSSMTFIPSTSPDFVARRFQVEEKVTQVYAQFNLDTKAGSTPVTGNVGLRAIGVDQNSKGLSANGNSVNPVSDGAKYWDFAPSLNLNFKVADQTYVRLSVARQLARPRMQDMRAGRNWGYDASKASQTDIRNSPWSAGEAGNPKLRPWKSDSIDLSFEKYFTENRGYFAFTGFYKKLLNFVYTQQMLQDFTGYPVRSGTPPALWQGITSTPTNGQGGNIRGIEATLSLSSELLNRDIKGFGLIMGGAYTDSSVKPWGPANGDAPIAGLSRKVANITLYYERHGFSARISERYRSSTREYITTFGVPNRGGDVSPNGDFSMALPEKVVDAQLSYTLQSGKAKGLTLFLQAYNLNDEPLITLDNGGDPRTVKNYQKYGASYSAGASYKF